MRVRGRCQRRGRFPIDRGRQRRGARCCRSGRERFRGSGRDCRGRLRERRVVGRSGDVVGWCAARRSARAYSLAACVPEGKSIDPECGVVLIAAPRQRNPRSLRRRGEPHGSRSGVSALCRGRCLRRGGRGRRRHRGGVRVVPRGGCVRVSRGGRGPSFARSGSRRRSGSRWRGAARPRLGDRSGRARPDAARLLEYVRDDDGGRMLRPHHRSLFWRHDGSRRACGPPRVRGRAMRNHTHRDRWARCHSIPDWQLR